MKTRHFQLRHDDLCNFIHVRKERQQMLIWFDGVTQKNERERGKEKNLFL